MEVMTFFARSLSASILLCFFINSAWADLSGQIVQLQGKAWLVNGVKQLVLTEGSKVSAGSKIHVEKESHLILLYPARAAIRVFADTTLLVGSDPIKLDIQLESGSVLSKIQPVLSKGKAFQVRTRAVSMGVRGTAFFVKVEKSKPDFICVCEGSVEIEGIGQKRGTPVSSRVVTASLGQHVPHSVEGELETEMSSRLKSAAMGSEHNDAQIAELAKLL